MQKQSSKSWQAAGQIFFARRPCPVSFRSSSHGADEVKRFLESLHAVMSPDNRMRLAVRVGDYVPEYSLPSPSCVVPSLQAERQLRELQREPNTFLRLFCDTLDSLDSSIGSSDPNTFSIMFVIVRHVIRESWSEASVESHTRGAC